MKEKRPYCKRIETPECSLLPRVGRFTLEECKLVQIARGGRGRARRRDCNGMKTVREGPFIMASSRALARGTILIN